MNETQNLLFATSVLEKVHLAAFVSAHPEDRKAAEVAILVQALILATPGLSPARRAGLFLGDEE